MRKVALCLAIVLVFGAQAFASPIRYSTLLSGAIEVPPNASPGTGSAVVIIDTVAHTLEIQVTFSDLIGTTTASHIHCCTIDPFLGTAMVATQTPRFIGFPVGFHSGTYSRTFDTSDPATWNAPFITAYGGTALGAEAALAAGLAEGRAYLNVHSTFAPGGEIRGFLEVPEPSTFLLLGSGLAGLALVRRRFIRR